MDPAFIVLGVSVPQEEFEAESTLKSLSEGLLAAGAVKARVIPPAAQTGSRGGLLWTVVSTATSPEVVAAVLTFAFSFLLREKKPNTKTTMHVEIGKTAAFEFSGGSEEDQERFRRLVLAELKKRNRKGILPRIIKHLRKRRSDGTR